MTLPLDATLVPLAWFVVVPGLLALAWWAQFRRTRTIEVWARAIGWQYLGTDPALTTRWHGTPFASGHSRRVSHLMVGTFGGRPALSFTYRYKTGSGKEESTYTFHVVSTTLPAYLPTLQLTPEHFGTRIARAFGGQDIAFESEDFNRAWRVQAPVERFAHDVLHPRLMERLLQPDARFSMRIEGTDILCWSTGATEVTHIAPRLQVLGAVVAAIPRFVWQDHGYDPGYGPAGKRPGDAMADAGPTGFAGPSGGQVPAPGPTPTLAPAPASVPGPVRQPAPASPQTRSLPFEGSPYRPPAP